MQSCVVFFAPPAHDKLPKGCKEGDVLRGSVTYEWQSGTREGEGKRPGGFPITWTVPPKPTKKDEVKPFTASPPDKRTALEKMAEDLRDWKVSRASKSVGTKDFKSLYDDALSSYPDWLPLLLLNAKHTHACHATPLKGEDGGEDYEPTAEDVVKACDSVIERVDEEALAKFLGVKHDAKDAERNEEKKVRDKPTFPAKASPSARRG